MKIQENAEIFEKYKKYLKLYKLYVKLMLSRLIFVSIVKREGVVNSYDNESRRQSVRTFNIAEIKINQMNG